MKHEHITSDYEEEYHKNKHKYLYTNPSYYKARADLAKKRYFNDIENLDTKKILEFGCFEGNTKITSEDFTGKKIKDIKIGEKVFTHKGRLKKVIKTFKRKYNNKIYEIKVKGILEPFLVTPEHPILCIYRKDIRCIKKGSSRLCKKTTLEDKVPQCRKCIPSIKTPKFLKAINLNKGDYLITPRPILKTIKIIKTIDYIGNYKIRKSPKVIPKTIKLDNDFMRLGGFWLAEGSFLKTHKRISGIRFSFNIREGEYINEVCKSLKKIFNETPKVLERPNKTITEIYVCNKKLGLLFFELFGERSHGKIIHKDIMTASKDALFNLFVGFYLGDGHLSKIKNNHNSIKLTTVSEKLRQQLFWIATMNGFPASILDNKVLISGDVTKIDKKGSINHKDNDVHTLSFKYGDFILRPIDSIKEKIYNGYVYNLEVDEDNSYISNHIAVHNCGLGQNLFWLPKKRRVGYDISNFAVDFFKAMGGNATTDITRIPNNAFDIVLSAHVLEHVDNPLETLRVIHSKLRKGGKLILITPLDKEEKINVNDTNQHLWTWTPQLMFNLLVMVGFKPVHNEIIATCAYKKLLPFRKLGLRTYNFVTRMAGKIVGDRELKFVAVKV